MIMHVNKIILLSYYNELLNFKYITISSNITSSSCDYTSAKKNVNHHINFTSHVWGFRIS